MRVYLNPGHDLDYDSGAVNVNMGLRECDIAADVGEKVQGYLNAAGVETMMRQSDNLANDSQYADRPIAVCDEANSWPADVFVSIHCNAANGQARGTEVECSGGQESTKLAQCIQSQIVDSIGTTDRGVKTMAGLIVIRNTDMPAVLVEMDFIDNDDGADLLIAQQDDFARAIARGITDYFQ
jgi:N-acetylmuramoyl-L-alanine amidase